MIINTYIYTIILGLAIGTVITIVSYVTVGILAKFAPEFARRAKESITLPYVLSFSALVIVYAIVKSVVPAIIAAGIAMYAPNQIIYAQQRRRKSLALEQLSAAVGLFSNTFLTTKSIPRGLEAVAKHVPAPVGEAFQTAYSELTFGVSINQVADQLAETLGISYAYVFASLLKSADKQGDVMAPLFRDLGYKIAAARDKANFQHTEVSTVRYTNVMLLALPVPAYLVLLNKLPEATETFLQTTAGNVLVTMWLVAIIAWVFLDRLIVEE